MESAIVRFIGQADELICELEQAVAEGNAAYANAEIALSRVREWRACAAAGTLPGAYRPNFGISKSDLGFGPAENRLYSLERLYVEEILPEWSDPA